MHILLYLFAFIAFLPAEAAISPSRVIARPLTQEELKFTEQSRIALEAAQAAYALPNLHSKLKLNDLRAGFAQFLNVTPAGFELWGADADLSTGLKFVIYKPSDGGEGPWVISITGTESLVDWLNNADLARPQLHGLEKIVELFSIDLLEDRELLITGHSLGGALAQAAAHEIQRRRNESGLTRKPITLITWNGFGAEELIQRFSRYEPALADQITIANFFVKGDLVSRIGRHFGPTFELRAKNENPADGMAETLRLHLLSTIREAVSEREFAPLREAPEVTPPFSKVIGTLTTVSWVLAPLHHTIHEFRQLWISRWIRATLGAATAAEIANPLNRAVYQYMYNVGVTELKRLGADTNPDKQYDRIQLEQGLERYRRYKLSLGWK